MGIKFYPHFTVSGSMKHIKFGVLPVLSKQSFPVEEWAQTVKNIEELGYSGVFKQDHFDTTAYDPIALLASAASVTKTMNIGSFVFSVDFRHPVILAKAAATLHLIWQIRVRNRGGLSTI